MWREEFAAGQCELISSRRLLCLRASGFGKSEPGATTLLHPGPISHCSPSGPLSQGSSWPQVPGAPGQRQKPGMVALGEGILEEAGKEEVSQHSIFTEASVLAWHVLMRKRKLAQLNYLIIIYY